MPSEARDERLSDFVEGADERCLLPAAGPPREGQHPDVPAPFCESSAVPAVVLVAGAEDARHAPRTDPDVAEALVLVEEDLEATDVGFLVGHGRFSAAARAGGPGSPVAARL